MRLSTAAPGKVNLSLLVGPRRPDGYHELFSVFAPVDLHDRLEFDLTARTADRSGTAGAAADLAGKQAPGGNGGAEVIPGGCEVAAGDLEVECAGVEGDENLAIRALRAVERLTNTSISGRVKIEKGIPVGAGMGGGSSDAAAALRTAARLLAEEADIGLEPEQLHALARSLGADVPFFLESRAAIARGVGEQLTPITLPPLTLVLVLPEEQLNTRDVYGAFDRLPAPGGGAPLAERSASAEEAWRQAAAGSAESPATAAAAVATLLENDLEAASFSLLRGLVERKRVIEEVGTLGALMSGSGPTMFGVCGSREAAEEAAGRLERRGFHTQVVKTA